MSANPLDDRRKQLDDFCPLVAVVKDVVNFTPGVFSSQAQHILYFFHDGGVDGCALLIQLCEGVITDSMGLVGFVLSQAKS